MMPRQNLPGVLVGHHYADDAGVFQLTSDIAVVQTVDFFPPIVDDPYVYGQIAATNALSDIYAMGGTPKTALSVVGFPSKDVEFTILGQIMQGGLDKLNEAGVALLGGHSVRDDEIKFGYAITGTIDPKQIKHNRGARPGTHVILTKPSRYRSDYNRPQARQGSSRTCRRCRRRHARTESESSRNLPGTTGGYDDRYYWIRTRRSCR